jgi:hypothetical protein
VWDRLFGSFEPESEPCVYGTVVPLAGWDPLHAVSVNYVDLGRKVRRARGWRDKLGVLLRPPSWQPASWPAPAQSLAAPPPDRPVGRARAATAVALFLLATACTGGLLWRADELGRAALAGVAASLVAGLWAIGAVLDRRLAPWAAGAVGLASAAACAALLRLA